MSGGEFDSYHKRGVNVTRDDFTAVIRAATLQMGSTIAAAGAHPPQHVVRMRDRLCQGVVVDSTRIEGGYNNTTYRVTVETVGAGSRGGGSGTGVGGSTFADLAAGAAVPAAKVPRRQRLTLAVRVSKVSSWPLFKLAGEVMAARWLRAQGEPFASKIPEVYFALPPLAGATDGLAALGMAWVDGVTADRALKDGTMRDEARERLAREMADFLGAMQQLEVPRALGRVASPFEGMPDGGLAATMALDPVKTGFVVAPFFDFCGTDKAPRKGPFADSAVFFREALTLRSTQAKGLVSTATEAGDDAARVAAEHLSAAIDALVARLSQPHCCGAQPSKPAHLGRTRPVLCHFDYCGRNMLVDPETGALNGVVDWEWACVFPAVHDWFAGFDDVGDAFRALVQQAAIDQGTLPGRGLFTRSADDRPDSGVTMTSTGAAAHAGDTGTKDGSEADNLAHMAELVAIQALDVAFPWHLGQLVAAPDQVSFTLQEVTEDIAAAAVDARRHLATDAALRVFPPSAADAPLLSPVDG